MSRSSVWRLCDREVQFLAFLGLDVTVSVDCRCLSTLCHLMPFPCKLFCLPAQGSRAALKMKNRDRLGPGINLLKVTRKLKKKKK